MNLSKYALCRVSFVRRLTFSKWRTLYTSTSRSAPLSTVAQIRKKCESAVNTMPDQCVLERRLIQIQNFCQNMQNVTFDHSFQFFSVGWSEESKGNIKTVFKQSRNFVFSINFIIFVFSWGIVDQPTILRLNFISEFLKNFIMLYEKLMFSVIAAIFQSSRILLVIMYLHAFSKFVLCLLECSTLISWIKASSWLFECILST